MKSIYLSLYLAFSFLLILSSCEKKLELAPLNNQTVETFYKTPQDAAAAITGTYAVLRSIYTAETIVTPNTVAADDAIPFLQGNADRRALWSYTFVTTNGFTGANWVYLISKSKGAMLQLIGFLK